MLRQASLSELLLPSCKADDFPKRLKIKKTSTIDGLNKSRMISNVTPIKPRSMLSVYDSAIKQRNRSGKNSQLYLRQSSNVLRNCIITQLPNDTFAHDKSTSDYPEQNNRTTIDNDDKKHRDSSAMKLKALSEKYKLSGEDKKIAMLKGNKLMAFRYLSNHYNFAKGKKNQFCSHIDFSYSHANVIKSLLKPKPIYELPANKMKKTFSMRRILIQMKRS